MKPIYARSINLRDGAPSTTSPAYVSSSNIRWANGGTLYRSQLQRCYTRSSTTADTVGAGKPIATEIQKVVKLLASGSTCAIDIEELGYNQVAWNAGRNQIDFIRICKGFRSDCRFGYYDCFGQVSNAMSFPAEGPWRREYSEKMGRALPLAKVVDFIAPSIYPVYFGPIEPGQVQAGRWPRGSQYGFDEWADFASWIVEMCRTFEKPVYPYFAPYTLLNYLDGSYRVPATVAYPNPWFARCLDHLLEIGNGVFFFERHQQKYEQPVINSIVETLEKATK